MRYLAPWVLLLTLTTGVSGLELTGPHCPRQPDITSDWLQVPDLASAGWSRERLEEARLYAAEIGSSAVVVVQGNHVVAAWGDVTAKHNVFSIRKSLVSALIGIADTQGHIDLNKSLADLGISDSPPLTAQERSATVADLLKARSGVYHTAAYETEDMASFRPPRDSARPGTHWFYNNWDFNTLGTIYEQATGRDLFRAFRDEIALPIGMQAFLLEDTRLVREPEQSTHAAHLFFMSARDLARFGQLWLQEGCWDGNAVVPASWVRRSVTSHSRAFDGGYGFASWWTYPAYFSAAYNYRHLPYDSYMTTGSGRQLVWVVPDLDLVFVHQHQRVDGSRVGAPRYWTLLDTIVAARTGK